MKTISISGAIACLLLGLGSAHAAGMDQDNMKKSDMDAKSGAMMHKSGAMQKNAQDTMSKDTMQKNMHGAMGQDTMQKNMHGTTGQDTMQK